MTAPVRSGRRGSEISPRGVIVPYTLPADQLADAVKRIGAARLDLDRPARRTWETPALVA